jgi:hypothetical protein
MSSVGARGASDTSRIHSQECESETLGDGVRVAPRFAAPQRGVFDIDAKPLYALRSFSNASRIPATALLKGGDCMRLRG